MKIFLLLLGFSLSTSLAQQKVPDALKAWEDWATWDEPHRGCPTAFNAPNKFFCSCPSELSLQTGAKEGRFALAVTVFHRTWFALPGDADLWPLNVQSNAQPISVVDRGGLPSVLLLPGTHHLAGDYRWAEMPQKIRVPTECGMVSLSVEGKAVPLPNWDAEGFLWLKRNRIEEGDKDFLGVQVYRLIEDGIPMWLHTVLELSVSGKSREVELGNPLPEGWSLSSVESPIPVAVDEQGAIKVQVRAGKWLVRTRAFRTNHSPELALKPGARPVAERELVGFKADPEFRMLDIRNAPSVDVTQTTFPPQWRKFPVYQWTVKTGLSLVEKMRGSGLQSPKSLSAIRELWLNESGRGYTYRDHLSGEMQSLWRLDVPDSLQLGSVKASGEGLLITRNPKTGATGVEIRSRNLHLEAVGTSASMRAIPATGWNADVDSLALTLNLPPGWRLLALFGAETVDGDWLTSWTLLDLFLLLIFSLAVFRLWGIGAGVIAFLAFGLTYHEPGSPRYAWLVLLAPLALLRVVPEGKMRKVIVAWKVLALIALAFVLVPFTYWQVQSVIYPQLEIVGSHSAALHRALGRGRSDANAMQSPAPLSMTDAVIQVAKEEVASPLGAAFSSRASGRVSKKQSYEYQASNLAQEPKAKIQTGPGVPDWRWRAISCRWNGPVSASQKIVPILLPPFARKLVILLGLGLVFWLLARLMGFKRPAIPAGRPRAGTALLILLGLALGAASAPAQQIPDKETLATLRQRLLKPSDSYPHCADIPSVSLQLQEDRLTFDARIDAAIPTAIPLPGKLPAWSPVRVQLDGKPESAVRRQDGYLWIVVPAGVHRVKVEGLLAGTREWEWNFLLKPRTVTIDAPGWTVTGLRKDGTPEQQVFFARKQAGGDKQDSAYDRREFNTLAVVDRVLEIGLTWQIHNKVTRLSAPGKAISMQIPLLPGEQILTSGAILTAGAVEVRLAANQDSFSWDSELAPVNEIALAAPKTDRWVERWHLVSSPVWNVALSGLPPLIESQEDRLVPVWHPWPGETASIAITRPVAVSGPTMTIHRVDHRVELGNRNRTSTLGLGLQCSVGDDLVLKLNPSAEVTSVQRGGAKIPVRREGEKLIIPVQPGRQDLQIAWKEAKNLHPWATLGRLELPVESSNIRSVVQPPANRWILWARGPLQGPAVRFWSMLICALLAAWALGRLPRSPLTRLQWALLMVGLTQVHLAGALLVVGWLFLLAWRGSEAAVRQPARSFNLVQVLLVLGTALSLGILLVVVYQGLLGNPEMFIRGNGSSRFTLNWYSAQAPTLLPQPGIFSVSAWFYRILMLLWALWLSHSLIRWLTWGWKQFTDGGAWQSRARPPVMPSKGA